MANAFLMLYGPGTPPKVLTLEEAVRRLGPDAPAVLRRRGFDKATVDAAEKILAGPAQTV